MQSIPANLANTQRPHSDAETVSVPKPKINYIIYQRALGHLSYFVLICINVFMCLSVTIHNLMIASAYPDMLKAVCG